MNHVMLDLETFGTAPGSVIRSIGAVEFDLSGATGKTFHLNIDEKSCLDVGLVKDPSTVAWWSQQAKAAQDALLVDPKPLRNAAVQFGQWFTGTAKATCVWGHGASFDPVLWEAACRAAGVSVMPWRFFNVRDTRTVFDLFDFDLRDVPRTGTHHSALDDALYQVKCLGLALRKGRAPTAAPQAEDMFG